MTNVYNKQLFPVYPIILKKYVDKSHYKWICESFFFVIFLLFFVFELFVINYIKWNGKEKGFAPVSKIIV